MWRLSGKEPACRCRRRSVPSLGREDPLAREIHGQKSLVVIVSKEMDTT